MSIEALDELAVLLDEPVAVTTGGEQIAVRALQIRQLPTAVNFAAVLFGDGDANFGSDEFLSTLDEAHIDAMAGLIALVTESDTADLQTLPIGEFLRLFNRVLACNQDFFSLAIRQSLMKTAKDAVIPVEADGPAYSSSSDDTDIPIPDA